MGLGKRSTAKQVIEEFKPDLKGKVAVVTGGNSGIGLETVKALASAGARVVLCSRSVENGQKAVDEGVRVPGEGDYSVPDARQGVPVDLSSVDTFVKDLEAEKSIDFLVLNAGVAGGPLEHVAGTGFEKHMAANHFGHAHLTNLLLPRIKAQNTPCRIVVVASAAHAMGDIDLNDINYKNGRKYSGMKAYGQSKLANILFAKALHDRLKDTQIVTSSLHPGVIATNIWRNAPSWVGKCLVPTFFTDKTVQQGAATQVWACFADGIGGKYLQDCKVKEPKKKAESVNDSDALWEATQKLLAEATTAR